VLWDVLLAEARLRLRQLRQAVEHAVAQVRFGGLGVLKLPGVGFLNRFLNLHTVKPYTGALEAYSPLLP
jgi:hypothetical protein